MKKSFVVLCTFSCLNCTSIPKEEQFKEQHKIIDNWVVYDKAMGIMMSPYLRVRGSATLCTQEFYLECYDISRSQCYNKLNSWSEECSELAMHNNSYEMFFGRQGYLDRFIGCMEVNHSKSLDLGEEQNEELMQCISAGKYDNAKSFRVIFDIK